MEGELERKAGWILSSSSSSPESLELELLKNVVLFMFLAGDAVLCWASL